MTPGLWEAVEADPDDLGAVAVLADALESAGDPLGTWISLGLAGAERRTWAVAHGVLGPLALREEQPWDLAGAGALPSGFATNVRLAGEEEAGLIEALHARGLTRAIRHLRLVGTARFDAVVTTALRLHPRLQSLELGPLVAGYGACDVPLQDVLDGFPDLRVLRAAPAPDLRDLRHPELRSLTICPWEAGQLEELDLSGFPALEHLAVARVDDAEPGQLGCIVRSPVRTVDVHRRVWEVLEDLRPDLTLVRASTDAHRDPLLTPVRQRAVRRFELDGRFWEIRREGGDLHLRYGKGDNAGTTKKVALRSAYEAATAYRERAAAKVGQGFREVVR